MKAERRLSEARRTQEGRMPEEGVAEILAPYRSMISATPELLSLLYDIDMLPEQTVTRLGAIRLVGLCEVWKAGVAGTLPREQEERGKMTRNVRFTMRAEWTEEVSDETLIELSKAAGEPAEGKMDVALGIHIEQRCEDIANDPSREKPPDVSPIVKGKPTDGV